MRSSPAVFDVDSPEAGPSTTRRGAARKARQSLSAMAPKSESLMDTVDHADKTVKLIKRNRKQRHTKLKEMITQEDDERPVNFLDERPTCPVCSTILGGDEDCVDAHVDACIANAARVQEEAEAREARMRREEEDVDPWGEYEADGRVRIGVSNAAGLRRLGVDVRDHGQVDMEDDIDIDGDDEVVFGDAQFTESDVLGLGVEATVDVEGDDNEEKTLRDLVAEGKVVTRRPVPSDMPGIKAEMEEVMGVGEADRMDEAIKSARKRGNSLQVIQALENKIKLLVRNIFFRPDSTSDRTLSTRNPCASHPPRPPCVESVSTHTPSPLSPPGAGIHAAESAGFAAWDQRSYVQCASALLQLRTCGGFICNLFVYL